MHHDVPEVSVSDFVALLNQSLEYAFPSVAIVGELANMRVSKNKWVYFDLKDDYSSVKCFGTVYQLSGPLEDGMLLRVVGAPRLHQLYGFSVTVQSILPVGEGSLKKAAALLQAKLEKEGLFDDERKRALPYPPKRIGLIASKESAAYVDFTKILQARWSGVVIELADVQVQGEPAISQIVKAIDYFNTQAELVDVLVLTRGGGSADDLAAFSTEQVTRAVAASRIPTLVAIGHEIDISLAELAADQRASTPSNAAELLTPDKNDVMQSLQLARQQMNALLFQFVANRRAELVSSVQKMNQLVLLTEERARQEITMRKNVLQALSPLAVLQRGYAVITSNGKLISSTTDVQSGQMLSIRVQDGTIDAEVTKGQSA